MKSTHRIFALPIIGTALALIGFGIVIGVRPTGPGQGTRLTVMIETSDPAARQLAHRVVKDRLDLDHGVGGRISPAGDRLIVEVASRDAQVIAAIVELVERRPQPGVNMPSPPPSAAALDAANAPPLHVTKRESFSRATGFLRAWPFFAIAGVLLVIAGVLWRRPERGAAHLSAERSKHGE